jgi:hypothetical protein
MVPPVADEREGLLAYLAQQRYVLRLTAYGLTDEQARRASPIGTLTVAGLVKHAAETEWSWIDTVREHHSERAVDDYAETFRLGPEETLTRVLSRYEEVAARTDSVLAGIPDLGQPVPVPPGVPWFPSDVQAWSVRWVLLHLIEETARHAGHADLVREAIDGATAFPLMAAAEHWPATPWLRPWEAPVG